MQKSMALLVSHFDCISNPAPLPQALPSVGFNISFQGRAIRNADQGWPYGKFTISKMLWWHPLGCFCWLPLLGCLCWLPLHLHLGDRLQLSAQQSSCELQKASAVKWAAQGPRLWVQKHCRATCSTSGCFTHRMRQMKALPWICTFNLLGHRAGMQTHWHRFCM